jgi:hypothetical protein
MEGVTERASFNRSLTDSFTDYEDFLTPAEIAAVTDWSNVSVRVSAT